MNGACGLDEASVTVDQIFCVITETHGAAEAGSVIGKAAKGFFIGEGIDGSGAVEPQ